VRFYGPATGPEYIQALWRKKIFGGALFFLIHSCKQPGLPDCQPLVTSNNAVEEALPNTLSFSEKKIPDRNITADAGKVFLLTAGINQVYMCI